MFLLRKFRFRTLSVIILVLLAVVMVMFMVVASRPNYGDDTSSVMNDQLPQLAVNATTLPLSDIIRPSPNNQTTSVVMYTPTVN